MRAWKKLVLSSVCTLASIILLGGCVLTAKAEGALQQGKTDGGLDYTYDASTGELVLTGSGTISAHRFPNDIFWLKLDIKSIKVKDCVIEDMSDAFRDLKDVESITFENVDTSKVDRTYAAFCCCYSLKSLDLSGWDTSSVKDMSDMFQQCYALSSLNLSGWDTSNVSNMGGMFRLCKSLKSLDLSSFDTQKLQIASGMFDRCSELKTLDLSNFDTSKCTWLERMFSGCSKLAYLNISSFSISERSHVTDMFSDCNFKVLCSPCQTGGVTIPITNDPKIRYYDETGKIGTTMAADGQSHIYTLVGLQSPMLILTQPRYQKVLSQNKVTFSTVAYAGNLSLNYQWYYSKDNGVTWIASTDDSGKTANYTIDATLAKNGYWVKCVATDPNGRSVTTNAVKLTVLINGPEIMTQPEAVTAVDGTNAKFSIVTVGKGLTYQWQYSQDKGKTWKNSGAASGVKATYVLGAKISRNGYLIRCVVTDENGKSVTSNAVKFTVTAADPVITTQPKAVTAEEGTNATFKIVATGTGLTYQWQYSQDKGKTWKNSGAASGVTPTYVLGAKISRNGYLIRCIIKGASGKTVTSNEVKFTVTAAGPTITTQPKAVTAAEGTNATFKIVATGTGLTYQWQYSQDNGSTWKNSGAASGVTATYVLGAKASRNGYLIRCKVTDADQKSVTSSAVKLTVTSAK